MSVLEKSKSFSLEFCSLVKSCMQALNLRLLTVLAMLHIHQMQWHSCPFLHTPTKGCPMGLLCGVVAGEGDWGSCWLCHFPRFWDQKGLMENHLWQIQPVFMTLSYPASQSTGHVSEHVVLRLCLRYMRTRPPARENTTLTNPSVYKSPSETKKTSDQLSSFFHPSLQYQCQSL